MPVCVLIDVAPTPAWQPAAGMTLADSYLAFNDCLYPLTAPSFPLLSSWAWLQVIDWKPLMVQDQVDNFCVQAAGGPIKVTLVWADPPADPSVAVPLVSDLDLTVHADSLSGYSLQGNGAPDRLNNVEQV